MHNGLVIIGDLWDIKIQGVILMEHIGQVVNQAMAMALALALDIVVQEELWLV